MRERINDKIKEIKGYVSNLESYVPSIFEEDIGDAKTNDACEHCFEKIIEALADLGFLVVKEKKLREPRDDIDVFSVLLESGVISEELSEKLKNSRRMRNIIAHEYGSIDNELVFEAVKNEIGRDAKEFFDKVDEEKR